MNEWIFTVCQWIFGRSDYRYAIMAAHVVMEIGTLRKRRNLATDLWGVSFTCTRNIIGMLMRLLPCFVMAVISFRRARLDREWDSQMQRFVSVSVCVSVNIYTYALSLYLQCLDCVLFRFSDIMTSHSYIFIYLIHWCHFLLSTLFANAIHLCLAFLVIGYPAILDCRGVYECVCRCLSSCSRRGFIIV